MKKYAIHPGYVVSKFDGDEHYITFSQLVILYGLDHRECINWNEREEITRKRDDYIHLYPKYDGNYKLSN